jgi:CSLREA domain-containing protein
VAPRLTLPRGDFTIGSTLRIALRNREIAAPALALAGLLTMALPAAAGAATIPVNSTADENTAAVDNGNCTLREAISAANLNGAIDVCPAGDLTPDTISLPSGTYALTLSTFSNDDNSTGDLDIDLGQGSVTIDGPDSGTPATITQTLATPERILHATTNSTNTLTLSDVVVTGGNGTSSGFGGGVLLSQNNSLTVEDSEISGNSATGGAGISDSTGGTTTITDSIIRGNSAVNSSAQSVPGGGISASGGAVTISGSLIANNTATGNSTSTSAGVNVEGGGVDMAFGSTLTIRDSTISGNSATATSPTAGPDANGGGIDSGSIVSITNTTFSGNSVSSADAARGGGIRYTSNPGTHAFAHNTFAGNDATGETGTFGDAVATNGSSTTPGAFRGNLFSGTQASETCGDSSQSFVLNDLGGNVDDGTSCDIDNIAQGSVESVGSVGLGSLGPAGAMDLVVNTVGPPGAREQLPVRQPTPSSPAVDRVLAGNCDDTAGTDLPTDERGFARPLDTDENGAASCESGAVELYECLGEGATIVGTQAGDGLIEGTTGPDVLHGGDGDDGGLFGLDGNDRICGGSGDDTIVARQGDDQIDGGEGTGDSAVFTASPGPVTVNLSTGTATGHGSDTLTRIEDARTGDFDDTLIGDDLPNALQGSNGDDTYQGGSGTGPDGDDTFNDSDFGGFVNTVSYANRADAIEADVSSFIGDGGDLIGAESDSISGILDVIGGQGADEITGTAGQANTLTGGPGEDTIDAISGADSIFVRDGGPDTADCGADNPGDLDSVEADVQGTDTLTNCLAPDLLDFALPPADPDPGTGNPGTTAPAKPKCKKGQKLKKVKGKFKCVKKKKKRR